MFSVIIPVYNGEKFIDNAINSVLSQTFEEWELIIVNDGSKDNTRAKLDFYKENEKIHIIHQENGGVSLARNNGMAMAKEKYIAFLDADDLWEKDHLEALKMLIENYPGAGLYATFPKVNLVSGGVIEECNYFKNRPEVVYIEDFFEEYVRDKSVKMFIPTSTCVTKEAAEKTGGFPVGCKIGEDLEFFLKVAAYYTVVLTKKITAVYEKGNSTATKDTSFDPDWGFFDTVQKLYSDEEISQSKKESIKCIMQWFTMRRCRHYIIDGNKKKAWKYFKDINEPSLKKDKYITFALFLLPCKLVKKIFLLRWRNLA